MNLEYLKPSKNKFYRRKNPNKPLTELEIIREHYLEKKIEWFKRIKSK